MKIDEPRLPQEMQALYEWPDEDEVEGCLLEGLDLTGEDLHAREFRGCVLRRCSLSQAELRRTSWTDVVFDHCDLSGCFL